MKILFWCCAVLLLWNCSDEDDPTSFYEEVNWFEIKDNPNDVLDHTIYQIYKETGIPIFYNDTIGSEVRGMDVDGNPILHYEILKVTYALTSSAPDIIYRVPEDRDNVLLGVELLRDYVMPEIPSDMHIHSFLLTDSLRDERVWWNIEYLELYKGLTTIAIGKMEEIGKMASEEKMDFANNLINSLLAYYLEGADGVVDAFYAVSTKLSSTGKIYDVMLSGTKEEYGFLSIQEEYGARFYSPTKEQDLKDYVVAVRKWTETEFKALYGEYEPMMEKFRIIKSVLDKAKT